MVALGGGGKVEFVWGAFAPLHGELQTVPKAELNACIMVLAKVSCGGSVELVTDSLVNYQMFEKGPMVGSGSTNNDMWIEFWSHAQRLGAHSVKMRWMKAHAAAARVASGEVGVLDLFCNACADALAGRAAKQAQVAPRGARNMLKYVTLVKIIQMRTVSILIHLADGNKGRPRTGSKKVKAVAAISSGGLALFLSVLW